MRLRCPYGTKPTTDFGGIPTLKLLIHAESPHGPAPFVFLFDTGADVTSLPVSAAEKLGIILANCPKTFMSGYEGRPVSVYKSQVRLLFTNTAITIPCVFHPNENVPILLGRAGILNRFKITLDGKKKEMIFEGI